MSNVVSINKARLDNQQSVMHGLMDALVATHLYNYLGVVGKSIVSLTCSDDCVQECGEAIQAYDAIFSMGDTLQGELKFSTTLGSDLPEPLLSHAFMVITQDYVMPYNYVPMSTQADIEGVFAHAHDWLTSFGLASEVGHAQGMFLFKVMETAFTLDLELVAYGVVPNHTDRPFAVVFQHNDLRLAVQVNAVVLLDQYRDYGKALQVD